MRALILPSAIDAGRAKEDSQTCHCPDGPPDTAGHLAGPETATRGIRRPSKPRSSKTEQLTPVELESGAAGIRCRNSSRRYRGCWISSRDGEGWTTKTGPRSHEGSKVLPALREGHRHALRGARVVVDRILGRRVLAFEADPQWRPQLTILKGGVERDGDRRSSVAGRLGRL